MGQHVTLAATWQRSCERKREGGNDPNPSMKGRLSGEKKAENPRRNIFITKTVLFFLLTQQDRKQRMWANTEGWCVSCSWAWICVTLDAHMYGLQYIVHSTFQVYLHSSLIENEVKWCYFISLHFIVCKMKLYKMCSCKMLKCNKIFLSKASWETNV